MRELNRCLIATKKIKELEEQIEEIRIVAYSPKVSHITGMPRGSNGSNRIEAYMEKEERLEKLLKVQKTKRAISWGIAEDILKANDFKPEYIKLFWLRFYAGLSWHLCAKQMNRLYPNTTWTEDKCFRVYGKLKKFR